MPRLVHSFGGVTTCISLVRKGKVLVEFRRVPVEFRKSRDLWFASCGSPRGLAPWVCLEAEMEGNESGSCRVCIRNLMTKKCVKGDGYWMQELVLGIQLFTKTWATLKSVFISLDM